MLIYVSALPESHLKLIQVKINNDDKEEMKYEINSVNVLIT
jgi:hypothetical protein